MFAYVRKFTYLSAALNSNKEYLTYGKVNIKSEKITPFGGIYYASKAFYALSLDKVINGTLGVRSSTYNGDQCDEIMSAMSVTRASVAVTAWKMSTEASATCGYHKDC